MVTQISKSGGREKERQLRRMEEYSCFGERALLTAERRSANVMAETKVRQTGRVANWQAAFFFAKSDAPSFSVLSFWLVVGGSLVLKCYVGLFW